MCNLLQGDQHQGKFQNVVHQRGYTLEFYRWETETQRCVASIKLSCQVKSFLEHWFKCQKPNFSASHDWIVTKHQGFDSIVSDELCLLHELQRMLCINLILDTTFPMSSSMTTEDRCHETKFVGEKKNPMGGCNDKNHSLLRENEIGKWGQFHFLTLQ